MENMNEQHIQQENVEQDEKKLIENQMKEQKENTDKQKESILSITDAKDALTKMEGCTMVIVMIVMAVVCSFTLNNTLNRIAKEQQEYIYQTQQQIRVLQTEVADLEEKLDDLEKDGMNINVNVNGQDANVSYENEENNAEEVLPDEPFDNRPFLGVAFSEEDSLGTPGIGLKVSMVYENSPAAFAGIKEGDYITAINGAKVVSFEDLGAVIDPMQPGDALVIDLLTIIDGSIAPQTVETTLTARGNFQLD